MTPRWPLSAWCLLMALAMVLGACVAPPARKVNNSYLVLLDDGDGKTGLVRFSTPQGETALDRPMQATRLAGPSNASFEVSAAQLERDFGAALAAVPAKAQTFLLYFQAGGSRLTAESEALLPQILQAIATRPVPDMSVTGHTDTAGDADTNVRLGLERAQFVARLLGSAQLDPSRVLVASHGEKNLLVATPDNTPEPRNRRVEVAVR
jgi:outer membrane protein OmpA-like peptidoglycan-associated protein